ncbi:MAG: transketolase [Helicobacteraceae bacterium]|jgi:transketolase|nr:transketolase [Helicobacteraceae bacterium]
MTNAEFALAARKDILSGLHNSLQSHIGSCLSCIDILSVLYNSVLRLEPHNPQAPNRDRLLLSKGHAIFALLVCLAYRGFIDRSDLDAYCSDGSRYTGHPIRDNVPGVEITSGSLGHGLPMASGMAVACRIKGDLGKVFCLMGDGECNEGAVWEAAMFAAKHRLNNLIAIVDRNRLQSYGRDEQVLDMGDLAAKFATFGWKTLNIDGHNYDEIEEAMRVTSEKPIAVIAHTIKGKGISFMEDKQEWHFLSPKEEHYKAGMKELNNA